MKELLSYPWSEEEDADHVATKPSLNLMIPISWPIYPPNSSQITHFNVLHHAKSYHGLGGSGQKSGQLEILQIAMLPY